MAYTVDASVHVNALNTSEPGSAESLAFIEALRAQKLPVFSPTLLLVEVAAAVARAVGDADAAIEMARGIRGLPTQTWVPLDVALTDLAARLAAEHRLRGADAVYAAVAKQHAATIVTLDKQQRERIPKSIPTKPPADALREILSQT